MTVSATAKRKDYTGDSVNMSFGYNWRVLNTTDLRVLVRSPAGYETTMIYGTDYTLTGLGNVNGGNVLFTVAPVTNAHITILPSLTLKQSYSFRNQAEFYGAKHEDAYDYVVMCMQQMNEVLGRAIVLPASFVTSGLLTNPVPGYALGVNATGDALTFVPNTGADQYAVLGDYNSLLNGAGRIGYTYGLVYGANTVGKRLNDLTDTLIPGYIQRPSVKTGTTTGTSPNFVLTLSPALTSYVGADLNVTFHANCRYGTPFINVNGLGNVSVRMMDSDGSLIDAMIMANRPMRLVYDGTYFVAQGALPRHGSLGAQTGALTSNYTLDLTCAGRMQVLSTGITSITLPTPSTIPSGICFILKNETALRLPITLNGNTIDFPCAAMEVGEILIIQSDGGSSYRLVSRSCRNIPNFNAATVITYVQGTVYQAADDCMVVVLLAGSYVNGIQMLVGPSSSPAIVVHQFGDDLNSNTKNASFMCPLPKGWYFKFLNPNFAAAYETVTVTVYANH